LYVSSQLLMRTLKKMVSPFSAEQADRGRKHKFNCNTVVHPEIWKKSFMSRLNMIWELISAVAEQATISSSTAT